MIICLDIGGSNVRGALVKNGMIIEKYSIKTNKNKVGLQKDILSVIRRFYSKKVKGISICLPGPADYKNGIILEGVNISLKGVNLRKVIKKEFNTRIMFENDANCFTLGEAYRRRKKNLVGLTLGTGVGSGIVINKKIYSGCGNAGEIGHTTINFNEKKGFVPGDVESFLSGKNIKKQFGKDPRDLKSKDAWLKLGYYLGVVVSNIVYTLDPEAVVIGGGISSKFHLLKKGMLKTLKKRHLKVKVIKGFKESGLLGSYYSFKHGFN